MTAAASAPPRALVLVHGAGSGPWVFDAWPAAFPSLHVAAVDLQAGLDPARASMADYARAVVAACRALPRPVALCGWSMGGLVALQAAAEADPCTVVLLEPSPPAEIQGVDETVEAAAGTFDPEAVYGRFPDGVAARPESARARAERKRGISVPRLPCPSLVVHGAEFPEERGAAVARLYGSGCLSFPDLDHFGLVLDPRVPAAVAAHLARLAAPAHAG